jgi:hypothetical protein
MSERHTTSDGKMRLEVGGEEVPMNRFVRAALAGVVEGFLSALEGVGPGEVRLVIPAEQRRPPKA